jgi:hypothetical protein
MKNKILVFPIITIALAACSSGANSNSSAKNSSIDTPVAATSPTTATPKTEVSVKGILDGYLHLKNALVTDNGNDAATAGTELLNAVNKMDASSMSVEQKKVFADVADDMKENAEHISTNAGKIEHQREHFEMLSKDIADMVKVFGTGGQTLYRDFCPMYNDGKGAYWISESKAIKNPYLGKAMPTCGTVKEEIK